MDKLPGISAAAVLFGFLFAGFWWSLDRELKFEPDKRHFKPSYALLFLSIAFVGYFGLIVPLRDASHDSNNLKSTYYAVTLGVVSLVGYMLTEFAHHKLFQRLKNYEPLEWVFFFITVVALAFLGYHLFASW